jgi:peptide/nickel transport system ATP-binding protein
MTPILEVRGLSKSFGTGILRTGRKVQALAGIDLRVEPGDTLGLVGESGCGKTTLARCAVRLLEPDEGTVCFDGVELGRLEPEELRLRRRQFQIIFQDPYASLDPRMTAGEILAEPFEAHGLADASSRAKSLPELLSEVALDGSVLGRYPVELSGGQKQRLVIARALALQPRLLFADEPVSALDTSVQAHVLNLLADLRQRRGLTLVLISHSLPVIRYLCSRVAVMYLGRIVEEAPADQFFREPKHPYSRALLDCMPQLNIGTPQAKPVLPGDVPSPAAPPPGCPFHPRCSRAIARCREERPELRPAGPAKVACFLHPAA